MIKETGISMTKIGTKTRIVFIKDSKRTIYSGRGFKWTNVFGNRVWNIFTILRLKNHDEGFRCKHC